MLKIVKLGLTLCLTLITYKASTAFMMPRELTSLIPSRLIALKASLFEVALTHTEQILTEVSLNQHPDSEHLEDALPFYEKLQDFTFLLLPEDLKKVGTQLKEQSNNLNPQLLKCSRIINAEQYEYIIIQAIKFVTATSLYCLGYREMALISALFLTQWSHTSSRQDIKTCQTLWKENGLTSDDAHRIGAEIDALTQTSFFSAAVLKLKYNDFTHLPWDTSDTWEPREWKQVDDLFLKIKILLTNLHVQLLGNPAESIYANRLNSLALSQQDPARQTAQRRLSCLQDSSIFLYKS